MNEYADRLAIDVVSAPLAEIDRRTLSQAWYSALHLARDAAASPQPVRSSAMPSNPAASPASRSADSGDRAVPSPATRTVSNANAFAVRESQTERRRPPSVLAKKIERALVRPQAPNRRATLTLQGRSGRIELLVRSTGTMTHVIAVCSPGVHARVEQALAHARFALARRGLGLQARAQGVQA